MAPGRSSHVHPHLCGGGGSDDRPGRSGVPQHPAHPLSRHLPGTTRTPGIAPPDPHDPALNPGWHVSGPRTTLLWNLLSLLPALLQRAGGQVPWPAWHQVSLEGTWAAQEPRAGRP